MEDFYTDTRPVLDAFALLDAVPLAITVWDSKLNLFSCARYTVDLLGLSCKQELLERFLSLAPKYQPNGEKSIEMLNDGLRETLETGSVKSEWTHLRADGEPIVFDVILARMYYGDEPIVVAYSKDIRGEKQLQTDVKVRDNLLSAQTLRYETILDMMPFPVRIADKDTNWIFVNSAAENLFGRKREDMLGKPCDHNRFCICGTNNCSLERAKQGLFQTSFQHEGSSYQVEVEVLKNPSGGCSGFIEMIHDVTGVASSARQQADLLQAALSEVKIANQAKSDFLANMSHEIRTPMNTILGVTEMLVEDNTVPAHIYEGLSKIYSSCGLLLGIINDVLDFSKIEAGKLDITPARYRIANLVNDAVHMNMMLINSKPIEFSLQIDEAIPAELIGDELRIKQILNNLLSNAFKYTDSGAVTLRVGFEHDTDPLLILEVKDTGRGMTAEQIEKLFDEYSRFQSQANRAVEGTGLGMAITQRLVYLMRGGIRVESEPGTGSRFIVSLPQEVASEEVLGKESAESLSGFKMSVITNRERVQCTRDPMPYGKVLLVDDMETNLYVAEGLLKLYSLKIDTAMSGNEAIEKIKNGSTYDIVLMDHMMPGMDGMETTIRLRKLGYKEPIVALTANAMATQAELFLRSGFDDFIAKPIDIRQLNAVLNRLVRDKQPPEVIAAARWHRGGTIEPDSPLNPRLRSSFVRDARKAMKELCEWHKNEENASAESLRRYTAAMHGIKSALANIGAEELSAIAKDLETAGKAEDVGSIRQFSPDFEEKLRALLEKTMSGQEYGNVPETSYLCGKLRDISLKCADYDRKGAKDILVELGQKQCTPDTREVLERIMEAVLHGEFEQAGELASNYAQCLNIKDFETKIEGLDIPRGLLKYGGDQKTYAKILRSYAASLARLTESAEEIGPDNLADYMIIVHSVKGASRDIYACELGHSAAKLEDAARTGNLEYIHRHHPAFYTAARVLAGEITGLLARIDAKTIRPKYKKPDSNALLKLLRACEIYDMDGVDAAIEEIGAYEYESGGELVDWLVERAGATDFTSITQKLAGYQA